MRPFLIFALACLLYSATAAAGDSPMHTFTDAQGRTMRAKVTLVSGDDVFITRDDGLATKVDIGIFSEKDQAFIREWAFRQKVAGGAVSVRFSEREDDKTKWEDSRSAGIEQRTWNACYEIIVKNESRTPLQDVRIEYLQMKFVEKAAATKRVEGKVLREKGESMIGTIPAREERSFRTTPFEMRATRLESNYYFENGGARESEDELAGIWVRVYIGDILALEESRPLNMREKEAW